MKTVLGEQYKTSSVASEPAAFRLGDVDVLPASGIVRGPEGERKLDPKVMEVLLRLAAAEGKVVSKEALMLDVWGDIIVTDFALSRCIYQLRKNLDHISGEKESPIKTLPKRGYCLTWPLEEFGPEPEVEKNKPWPIWLVAFTVLLVTVGVSIWQDWNPLMQSQDRPAIAVMPFKDMTLAVDMGYFGDGIAQTLLTELGHIKEIDVIAHSSSFSLRDTDMKLKEIAAALDIQYVVEGSVSRESDVVHVSASLIDAHNGRQLWSKTFQSIAGQSFSVQRDMATEIAGYLEVSLGDPSSHGGTESYGAFEAYLRAIEVDDAEIASVFIDEALDHDENFARALVAKAHFTYVRLWQGIGSAEGTWAEVRPVLDRALSITDELPYAHVLIAGFQMMRERYDAAEIALKRALEINPSHNEAFVHLSRLMEKTGRVQEAVVLAKRNVRLDPLNSTRHMQLANRQWTAGDIEAGKASFERALELDPLNHSAWRDYAHRLGDLENPVAAFRLVARLQQNPQFRSQFFGPVPKIPPAGVQVFGLWFGFVEDYERERVMLQLQSEMADSARLHRELAWALIGEGDLDGARREAWVGLNGMPRESIVNFQVAYISLQTGQGMHDVLNHYRSQWPGLFGDSPKLDSVPKKLVVSTALIHRELGEEQRALRLLDWARKDGTNPFGATAMALAHLGEIDMAINALNDHINRGGYFSYLPKDPFWSPLAEDARFMAIVDARHKEAADYRAQIQAMIETGKLVLPGQLKNRASLQDEHRL